MLSNGDYYSILWLDRMRVDCPLIISSSLIWQFVWTFPASRRSHCARLFPPLIFCIWPIPFQRENLNVNLNFHHLIFCWAPLYHGLMAVDEAQLTKELQSHAQTEPVCYLHWSMCMSKNLDAWRPHLWSAVIQTFISVDDVCTLYSKRAGWAD